MTELNIPELPEEKLTPNQKLLATAVVAMVVSVLVRRALNSRNTVVANDIESAVKKKVLPIIENLSDGEVMHHLNAKKNYGPRRRFLEGVLDIFLGSKR